MRPPHYTGENKSFTRHDVVVHKASMRPPHYTGENVKAVMNMIVADDGFNEAPALHGGKRQADACQADACQASMRPPHYTGENASTPGRAAETP